MELRTVLEEPTHQARGAFGQEQAEVLETVTGTIRTWLKAPAELPEEELQASLSLLHHLSTARPAAYL